MIFDFDDSKIAKGKLECGRTTIRSAIR